MVEFDGGTAQIGIKELADYRSLDRELGQNLQFLCVDQAEQFGDPTMIDQMRSNLRGEQTRFVISGHPGGPGDSWIRDRYVLPSEPWIPFIEPVSNKWFCRTDGTYRDNSTLAPDFKEQLLASTPDPYLRRAWLENDWLSGGFGSFFGDGVFEVSRNVVEDWLTPHQHPSWWKESRARGWRFYWAYDHGTASPAVGILMAASPGAHGPDRRWYPRGSRIAIDEVCTARSGSLTAGQNLTVPEIALLVKRTSEAWHVKPSGVADDSIFTSLSLRQDAVTIAQVFADSGVHFSPARKGSRTAGWERMRVLLQQAGAPDLAGLFIAKRCTYALKTIPHLPRDRRNPEDLATDSPDHAADAIRYGVLQRRASGKSWWPFL